MESKEFKCTCKVVFSKALLICGIVAGALLAILGIVTITGDTHGLFYYPFVRWYTTDYHVITFSETKGFSNHDPSPRPHQYLQFQWTSNKQKYCVMQCDSKYEPLKVGFRTKYSTNGDELVKLNNLTIDVHYFCASDDQEKCLPSASYQGRIHMHTGTPFWTNGVLNQNFRFSFFMLAAVMVVFGVVMILGELHVPLITTKFTFFYYSFVKGIIYIAVGFLVMGMSNIFGLFVAIVLWGVGIANCVYGWRTITTFQWIKVGARGTTTIVTRREYI